MSTFISLVVTSDRPRPPVHIGQIVESTGWFADLVPAPELLEWVKATLLDDSSPLFNEEHLHLVDADLEFMWSSAAYRKAGRMVLGQAEQVAFRVGGWQKARAEQQMGEWFGRVPSFLITLVVGFAWWWRWYVRGVVLTAWLTGCDPDPDRLTYWAGRAVRVRRLVDKH